jgi:putative ABC transport system ATP-binding protein
MVSINSTSSIMPQVIISAQQLTQTIQIQEKKLTIFQDLNLEIYAGEQVAITGRSGSGKSTLLGILATLDQPSSGRLSIHGQSVEKLNEEQRAAIRLENIGFVFQSFQLLPSLTALENVMLPLRIRPDFNYAKAEEKALYWLSRVGLERQSQQTPKVLSGGEQQRVAIARALISDPKVIFADEPTGNLDGTTAQEIEQLLFDLNHELGTTLILVTHDQNLAKKCEKHYELVNGSLVLHSNLTHSEAIS